MGSVIINTTSYNLNEHIREPKYKVHLRSARKRYFKFLSLPSPSVLQKKTDNNNKQNRFFFTNKKEKPGEKNITNTSTNKFKTM